MDIQPILLKDIKFNSDNIYYEKIKDEITMIIYK